MKERERVRERERERERPTPIDCWGGGDKKRKKSAFVASYKCPSTLSFLSIFKPKLILNADTFQSGKMLFKNFLVSVSQKNFFFISDAPG
jgi:hypothetical protein